MDIHFETISSVGEKLRSGELSSIALTDHLLQRISETHERLNAFITVTGDLARGQARKADSELKSGRDRGPLHGIPIAVKDLFQTEGVLTTCGSKLFCDWVPEEDASVIKRVREAGAVILGKTGLHELAYGTDCINAFYGAIQNPWKPGYDPGGSSGGSAVAVAAGLCYAALGTDTGCSVRQPAHCCGIVGYKPTFGVVSKAGVFPLVWTLDHVGILTRNTSDAASVFEIVAGYDSVDPYSVHAQWDGRPHHEDFSLRGARIGVVRSFFFDGSGEVVEVVEKALEQLEAMGASLIELELPDASEAFDAAKATFAEAFTVHQKNIETRPDSFSEQLHNRLNSSASVSAADYINAQHFRRGFTRRLENLLSECDFLAAPTATISASSIANRPEEYGINSWRNTVIFNLSGQPSISIPCGFTKEGVPVGLMLSGQQFEDPNLLRWAHSIQSATNWNEFNPAI